MSRRTPATILVLLTLAATGCHRSYASLSPQEVCASPETLGRIQHAVLAQATAEASSQTRYALDSLAPQLQTKLVRPLVESYDHDTHKTTCTAQLVIWLPAGVATPRELQGAIHYDSQPTADRRDVVFNVSGLEQVAAAIAGADLSTWAAANAPRKPGLVVEVVPRSATLTTAAADPAPAPRRTLTPSAPTPALRPSPPQALAATTTRPPPPSPSPPQTLAATTTRTAPPAAAPAPAAGTAIEQPTPVAARSYADGPVRVFVHVAGASELPAADQVRSELAGLDIAGAPVAAPPARLVADMPRRTEVRCLKRRDCAAARQVAAYVARSLGTSVAVVDMSGTYESDPGVRPGSLELWLKPTDGSSVE